MIPKVIHYCWFNKKKKKNFPPLVDKCIKSWKFFLPDYKIICWNEENFDLNTCKFVKEAFEAEKYAFVSDYVRLYVLFKYGGIYLDTDVEIVKSFDTLLNNKAIAGFKSKKMIDTCVLGTEKNNDIFRELLNKYNNKSFYKKDGSMDLQPNTEFLLDIFKKYNIKMNNELQKKEQITIYPKEYFSPYEASVGKLNITSNTYAIHWCDGSWVPLKEKNKKEMRQYYYKKYKNFYPDYIARKLSNIIVIYKMEGMSVLIKRIVKKILRGKGYDN